MWTSPFHFLSRSVQGNVFCITPICIVLAEKLQEKIRQQSTSLREETERAERGAQDIRMLELRMETLMTDIATLQNGYFTFMFDFI